MTEQRLPYGEPMTEKELATIERDVEMYVGVETSHALFHRARLEGAKRQMMVVDVSPGIPIRVSRGRRLFEDSYNDVGYDVLPDGQHFVMVEIDQEASRITHFNVVLNWFEELKRLVPPK